jgi:YfiH family protein
MSGSGPGGGVGEADQLHVAVVVEAPALTDIPLLEHPEWARSMPWLEQGITWRGDGGTFDLGLAGETPVGVALGRWRAVRAALGFQGVVHSRQVHSGAVQVHSHPVDGIQLGEGVDGHATCLPQVLLTVSVADCIPVSIVDPERRAIALLHAGWRGIVAGILEAGLARLAHQFGSRPQDLRVHLGPAICGDCYEVGPEVWEALGLERPAGPRPIDLRTVAARRLLRAGVTAASVSRSASCPRCDGATFFSHRGGSSGRQMAILGIRTHDR